MQWREEYWKGIILWQEKNEKKGKNKWISFYKYACIKKHVG